MIWASALPRGSCMVRLQHAYAAQKQTTSVVATGVADQMRSMNTAWIGRGLAPRYDRTVAITAAGRADPNRFALSISRLPLVGKVYQGG
jgi:hypothetical protein